jgi:dTDP-4-dehydrorhamnose reductase
MDDHTHESNGMNVLLLGSTGLLGQAMSRELRARGCDVRGVARRDASIAIDVTDDALLTATLRAEAPDMVVNCAALVDIDACEKDPGLAWRSNARPLSFLAEWALTNNRPLLHISTDQYYTEGANVAHDEKAPVSLLNEYARTKFAGEALALTAPQSLVLRTSIVGVRGWVRPTFAEWAIDVVEGDKTVNLFSDAFTSSIDVTTFAKGALDLFERGKRGLYNLAAQEVYSKEAFVREIAAQLGRPLTHATVGSVNTLATRRANCLGLDVKRAQNLLGYPLPVLKSVVASILIQRSELRKQ